MARLSRYKQGNRLLCRGIEAQPIHVGCLPWPVRLRYASFLTYSHHCLSTTGVNLRVNQIFKMTPEMTSALSSTPSDENSSSLPEVMPLSDSFSQSNSFDNSQNQPPVNNDPFSISKNRINGDIRPNAGSSALFEKLNGSRSVITPVGAAGNYPILDTPTGLGGGFVTEIHPNKDAGGVTAVPIAAEPPHAPMRKVRTLQGMGVEFGAEAPPK